MLFRSHSKIVPVPIGPKWQWTSTAMYGESKGYIMSLLNYYDCQQAKSNFLRRRKNLVYMNFNINTSKKTCFKEHTGIRKVAHDKLGWRYSSTPSSDFDGYLKDMQEYKFALSPPGAGIDTHRTWEALMLGVIPIVWSTSSINSLYDQLPVLIVNDWSILTKEYLEEQYELIRNRVDDYCFEKLTYDYWKNQINDISNK